MNAATHELNTKEVTPQSHIRENSVSQHEQKTPGSDKILESTGQARRHN